MNFNTVTVGFNKNYIINGHNDLFTRFFISYNKAIGKMIIFT